jgi:hypothetical protein
LTDIAQHGWKAVTKSNTPRDFVTIDKEEKENGVKLPINTGKGTTCICGCYVFSLDYIVYKDL